MLPCGPPKELEMSLYFNFSSMKSPEGSRLFIKGKWRTVSAEGKKQGVVCERKEGGGVGG